MDYFSFLKKWIGLFTVRYPLLSFRRKKIAKNFKLLFLRSKKSPGDSVKILLSGKIQKYESAFFEFPVSDKSSNLK